MSFDAEPTAFVTVHKYVPLSALVGDFIVMKPSFKPPPTYLFFLKTRVSPFFIHTILFNFGKHSSKTL